jgi:hypothetical protein
LTPNQTSLLGLMIAAVLAFGAAPVYAATTNAAAGPAASPPAAAAPAPDSGDQGSAPPEAPVPDPFLAEVLKTCRDGASGDKGTFQRLQDQGWNLAVDGNTETPFYQAFNGEKDFDGVGTVDLTYSLEVYPSMTEGYCSLSIDSAARRIGIGDLAKMPELKGEIRTTDDGIASNWEENVAQPHTFIQADQHKTDLYFLLDVTTLMQRPAADIPYVAPPPDDNGGPDNGGGGSDPGTNAAN